MGKSLKRGVATITCYVYGETDEELKQKSNDVCRMINGMEPSCDAGVEKLGEQSFGKIGDYREIKF